MLKIELAIIIGQIITLFLVWRVVRSAVEASKLITASDRRLLQEVLTNISKNADAVQRLEVAAEKAVVAAEKVAQDLSDAHFRADQVTIGAHGAKADEASSQTEEERQKNNNPHRIGKS